MPGIKMKDKNYWKRYPVISDSQQIESALSKSYFMSEGKEYELICFYQNASAENVLITPGSGGHAYVFAELGYLIYKQGFNVFIMPKHGGYTIPQLSRRHKNAIAYITSKYSGNLHLYGEGLGGLVIFYLGLEDIKVRSIICENSPAILDDNDFHNAMKNDGAAGRRRTLLLPLFKLLVKILPSLPIPIKSYLGWEEVIDFDNETNCKIEKRLVKAYNNDPDFDKAYPLKAVMSLVNTPPPNSPSTLSIPTMFILTKRGLIPAYFKNLFMQLGTKTKKLEEIDGGVFWMLSNPQEAGNTICNWINKLKIEASQHTFNYSNENY
jgi:hypothetical protein